MIKRQLAKSWFSSRKISPIIFIKSCILHIFQKKSWRLIAAWFPHSHIPLYNFYNTYKNTPEFKQILFTLAEHRIIVYIEGKNNVTEDDLNNNEQVLELTLQSLNYIVEGI